MLREVAGLAGQSEALEISTTKTDINRERGRSRAYVLTGHANARTSERIVCVPERAHVGQRIDSRTSTIVFDRLSESLDEHARIVTSAGHACARTHLRRT